MYEMQVGLCLVSLSYSQLCRIWNWQYKPARKQLLFAEPSLALLGLGRVWQRCIACDSRLVQVCFHFRIVQLSVAADATVHKA